MPQNQLAIHMRYIRRQAAISAPGSNRRQMFVSLYQWCVVLQQKGFSSKPKRNRA